MAKLTVHCSRVIEAAKEILADRNADITRRREALIDDRMRRPRHWFTRQHPTREEAIQILKSRAGAFVSPWEEAGFHAGETEYRATRLLKLAESNPFGYMELTDKDVQYLAPLKPPTQRTE